MQYFWTASRQCECMHAALSISKHAVSTFLLFNGPYSSMPLEQLQGPIFFYGLLYLFVGITVGVFAAMLRSYREKFAVG